MLDNIIFWKWRIVFIISLSVVIAVLTAPLMQVSAISLTNASSYNSLDSFDYIECDYAYKNDSSKCESSFIYNDGMLLKDARSLSPDLAKASVALAVSAYNNNSNLESPDYVNCILNNLGFTYENYNYDKRATLEDNDFVAFTIGTKSVEYNGKTYKIYCVPIRGTSKNDEWYSNFDIGSTDNHYGFYTAEKGVYSKLKEVIKNDASYNKDNTIIWITGHSRGAAVANILAGKLTESEELATAGHIFGYTYACPAVSCSDDMTTYSNIQNFNNAGDIVTEVPLKQWGFSRYGVTNILPENEYNNVSMQFEAATETAFESKGADFAGDFSKALATIIPSKSDAVNKTENKIVMTTIAWFLSGAGENYISVLRSNDISIPQLVLKAGFDSTGNALTALERLERVITLVDSINKNYLELQEFYLLHYLEVEIMHSGDDFISFRELYKAQIDDMEDAVGYDIYTADDFKKAGKEILESQEFCNNIQESATNVLNLVKDQTPIKHGHTQATYVTWINSLFLGDNGWANSDESDSQYVYDKVTYSAGSSIGSGCFSKAEFKHSINSSDIRYVGEDSFMETQVGDVKLPNIRIIGNNAFRSCSLLSSFEHNLKIEKIGDYAFYECVSLEEFTIPDNIEKVGKCSFQCCYGMKKLTFPADLHYYDDWDATFGDVHYLSDRMLKIEEIHITKGKTGIMERQYFGSPMRVSQKTLKKLTIDEGVISICTYACRNCSILEELSLPSTLKEIGDSAFYNCSSIHIDSLPEELEIIGDVAFAEAGEIANANLPKIEILGTGVFWGSGLEKLTIGPLLEVIQTSDFGGCSKLKSVKLSEGLRYIGDNAFLGCSSITELIIPDSVVEAGESAFVCTGLKKLTYPASMSYCGKPGYDNCTFGCSGGVWSKLNIEEIHITKGSDGIMENLMITPMRFSSSTLKTLIIDEGVIHIGDYACWGISKLVNLTLPDTIESVGDYAFEYCSSLEFDDLPKDIKEIGESAFHCVGYIGNADLSKLEKLGTCAFCKAGIKQAVIGDKISKIPDDCFYCCKDLTNLELPSSIESIGDGAFEYCKLLNFESIPDGIETVGRRAFRGVGEIKEAELSSISSLGEEAFSESGVMSVIIGEKADCIPDGCFSNCGNLEEVYLECDAIPIADNAFYNDVLNVNYSCISSGWNSENMKEYGGTITWGTDHRLGMVNQRINPTCNKKGREESYNCMYCGQLHDKDKNECTEEDITIQALGHDPVKHEAMKPDGDTDGNSEYYSCSRCEKYFKDAKCTEIISENSWIICASHNCEGDWKYDSDKHWQVCSKCHKTYSENHSFGEWIVVSKPSENSNGIKQRECTVCHFAEIIETGDYSEIFGKDLYLPQYDYTYNGKEHRPKVTLYSKYGVLVPESEYDVSYSNNINAGTATVTVTGKNGNWGSVSRTFTIHPIPVFENPAYMSDDYMVYDGKAKEPRAGITGLVEGRDYIVKYVDNVNAGMATVIIEGIGNYYWSLEMYFEIMSVDITDKTATISSKAFTYDGKSKKPIVKVNGLLKSDYSVSYSNNIKCGRAKVVIKGKGNYTGTITKTFTITPAKAAISKATAGKKKITVKIKSQKASGVSGYQIYYKKAGSSAKSVTTTSTSKVLTGLVKGKKYTVKVRAYKTIDGKKYYGAYSKAKTVTVK